MVMKIVRYPEPVLRARCKTVPVANESHKTLAKDMLETMKAANGVGLAAPQVGKDEQLAVIDVSHNPECVTYFRINGEEASMVAHMPVVFLNPKIEPIGKHKETDEEGCLSFPGLRSQIRRPAEIKVTYQNLQGETITIETDGLLARAFQHETDHLNGILFIDRMSAASKLGLKKKLARVMQDWDELD